MLHVVGIVVVAQALSACAAPVEAVPPSPPDHVAAECRIFTDRLPATLEGGERRDVRPESALTAAWGRPAIVLRCGVPRPSAYASDAAVISVNGVDWLPEQTAWGYVFTTVGRRADVEVRVPREYAPEVNPLTDISSVVAGSL